MRSRLVHPGLFENEVLGKLDPNCTILFVGLSCYCDREGLFEWRPERIAARLFPYRKIDINKALQALLDNGFIEKRSSNLGDIGCIPKFLSHQRPHLRETPSKLLETFKGLPKNNPGLPRANLGEPTIDIDIEIETEIETLKEGSLRETNQQVIPYPGCVHFKMSPKGEQLAREWYMRNGFDPDLVGQAIEVVEAWMDAGNTSAARQARKSKDHHKQLYAPWVLEKLSKVEVARRQLNGHQKLTPAQEMLRLSAIEEAKERR